MVLRNADVMTNYFDRPYDTIAEGITISLWYYMPSASAELTGQCRTIFTFSQTWQGMPQDLNVDICFGCFGFSWSYKTRFNPNFASNVPHQGDITQEGNNALDNSWVFLTVHVTPTACRGYINGG
jgi:hypothetical protein